MLQHAQPTPEQQTAAPSTQQADVIDHGSNSARAEGLVGDALELGGDLLEGAADMLGGIDIDAIACAQDLLDLCATLGQVAAQGIIDALREGGRLQLLHDFFLLGPCTALGLYVFRALPPDLGARALESLTTDLAADVIRLLVVGATGPMVADVLLAMAPSAAAAVLAVCEASVVEDLLAVLGLLGERAMAVLDAVWPAGLGVELNASGELTAIGGSIPLVADGSAQIALKNAGGGCLELTRKGSVATGLGCGLSNGGVTLGGKGLGTKADADASMTAGATLSQTLRYPVVDQPGTFALVLLRMTCQDAVAEAMGLVLAELDSSQYVQQTTLSSDAQMGGEASGSAGVSGAAPEGDAAGSLFEKLLQIGGKLAAQGSASFAGTYEVSHRHAETHQVEAGQLVFSATGKVLLEATSTLDELPTVPHIDEALSNTVKLTIPFEQGPGGLAFGTPSLAYVGEVEHDDTKLGVEVGADPTAGLHDILLSLEIPAGTSVGGPLVEAAIEALGVAETLEVPSGGLVSIEGATKLTATLPLAELQALAARCADPAAAGEALLDLARGRLSDNALARDVAEVAQRMLTGCTASGRASAAAGINTPGAGFKGGVELGAAVTFEHDVLAHARTLLTTDDLVTLILGGNPGSNTHAMAA